MKNSILSVALSLLAISCSLLVHADESLIQLINSSSGQPSAPAANNFGGFRPASEAAPAVGNRTSLTGTWSLGPYGSREFASNEGTQLTIRESRHGLTIESVRGHYVYQRVAGVPNVYRMAHSTRRGLDSNNPTLLIRVSDNELADVDRGRVRKIVRASGSLGIHNSLRNPTGIWIDRASNDKPFRFEKTPAGLRLTDGSGVVAYWKHSAGTPNAYTFEKLTDKNGNMVPQSGSASWSLTQQTTDRIVVRIHGVTQTLTRAQ